MVGKNEIWRENIPSKKSHVAKGDPLGSENVFFPSESMEKLKGGPLDEINFPQLIEIEVLKQLNCSIFTSVSFHHFFVLRCGFRFTGGIVFAQQQNSHNWK